MATTNTVYHYLRNDTILDGTSNKTPMEPGESANLSFFGKRNAPGFSPKVNLYLSHDSTNEWTCIIGKRATGVHQTFSLGGDWKKFSYTAQVPSEDGDTDFTGGTSVSTWTTASIQVTSSMYVFGDPAYPIHKRMYLDNFKLTANKPQVHASQDGILIYNTGDNYINMDASGLEVRGGNINTNDIVANSVESNVISTNDLVTIDETQDLVIGRESAIDDPGNVIIQAAPTVTEGGGEQGGSILLIPASGSEGGTQGITYGVVSVSGSLNISTALSKGSGTFKIKHPNPVSASEYYLQHSFVESPTCGDNLYRWSENLFSGSNSLDLPDYYRFLNENSMVWVNPIKHFGRGYGKVNENQTQIDIEVENDGEYNILCIGTRKDKVAVDNFKGVIIDRENN